MLLEDKVAVVTGVGPGLGQATAMAFAREGAAVGLVARNEDRIREIADRIAASGGRALPLAADVTEAEQCARVVAATVEEYGGLDCLVNSAFRPDLYGPFEHVDVARWRGIFEVNLFGALQLTQAAIPHLKQRASASIVMVGSMSMRKIREGEGGYAASKAALYTATQVLAKELGPDGIRVNTVVPGWIWGPSVRSYVEWQSGRRGVAVDEIVAEIEARIPLGFIPAPEDVAEAIVFLASDLSRTVTGQGLDVNGGEYFH